MTERVRITGPPRHTTSGRPLSRLGDVHEQTPLGDVYLRSLLRAQLGLASRLLLVLAITVGVVPLLFHLAPTLADRALWGVPLPWLLLGVLAHPFLLLLAWRYVRRAEANERAFVELVRDPTEPEPPSDGRSDASR